MKIPMHFIWEKARPQRHGLETSYEAQLRDMFLFIYLEIFQGANVFKFHIYISKRHPNKHARNERDTVDK